jgi:SAM-dependent methyltransferase/uncharacterized protein YbaR (Trm112 family)
MEDHSWTAVELRTRRWLEARLHEGVRSAFEHPEGIFGPDGRPRGLTAYHFQLLQRKLKIFRLLDQLGDFASFVDVGAGFEAYPRLVRERYGVPAVYADFNHYANLPLDGFPSDRLDRAVTAGIARLPFADDAFDVVLCSEVLEHLVRPVEALAELLRVARRAVILTSLEALAPHALKRRWLHYRVDVTLPHVERNFLSLRELRALLGDDCHFENLLDSASLPSPLTDPTSVQHEVYARLITTDALVDALCVAATPVPPLTPRAAGILALKRLGDPRPASAAPTNDRTLAAWLVARTVAIERERLAAMERYARHVKALRGMAPIAPPDAVEAQAIADLAPSRERPTSATLLPFLCCPDCRGPLEPAPAGLRCAACAAAFPADYGVPVLLPQRDPDDPRFAAEAVDRLCGADARRRRVVTRVMRRLRRNEKPAGRLRRSVWAAAAWAGRSA